MNAVDYAFRVESLRKSFKLGSGQTVRALEGVSVSVRRGGIAALVGPDGAGKTTFLRLAAGLLQPDSGTMEFSGDGDVVGYMPQKFGLYEDLTVQENLELYADLRGLAVREREARYAGLLAMSGMEPFRRRMAGNLSGGMKQKLGLVCTLLVPPTLLLLDEPTVGVDPLSRRELWRMISSLTRDGAMSVIISTAYMDEAARCDDVTLLFEGRALAAGSPESLRAVSDGMSYMARPEQGDSPRSLQARLLDAPGVVDAVPQGGCVRFVHGALDSRERQALNMALLGAAVSPVPSSLEDSFMVLLQARAGKTGRSHAPEKRTASSHGEPRIAPGVDEEPVIVTNGVSRYFGDFAAVNNVSFSIRRGEVFGLLGPNGAGKTTTFRMLCGLLPASSGTLRVAGVDVRETREEARRRIGYVAQKFSLYGPLSVLENLEFFAGAYGLRGLAGKLRIGAVTGDFELGDHLDVPAEELPGGFKQRLAMAVGLLHQPAILFLDEPTSGADPQARRAFWKRISALADQGVTIVVTTHFMEEAEYCDRVLIQDGGVMLALGTPAELRTVAAQAGDGEKTAGEVTMEDAFISIVEKARRDNKDDCGGISGGHAA